MGVSVNIASQAPSRLLTSVVPKVSSCYDGIDGGKYYCIQTMDQFDDFYSQLTQQTRVAVDTETSGLDWVRAHACGLVFGWGPEHNYYLPIAHQTMEQQLLLSDIQDPLAEYLARTDVSKIFWNAKFDLHFLRKAGMEVGGIVHDGVVMFHLLDENSEKKLKVVADLYFGSMASKWETTLAEWRLAESKRRRKAFSDMLIDTLSSERAELEAEFNKDNPFLKFSGMKTTQITAKLKAFLKEKLKNHKYAKNKKDDITYDHVPLDIMTPYACADTHYTWEIHNELVKKLSGSPPLRKLYVNEMKLSESLFEVESHGVKCDIPYLKRQAPEFRKLVREAEAAVYREVGYEFNLGSNMQLILALQKAGCRLTKLTKAGKKCKREMEQAIKEGRDEDAAELKKKIKFSCDSETLEYLGSKYPFAFKVLQYRAAQKLLNTYVLKIIDMVDSNHFLHTTFNANVSTGRMSSRDPNLQNIPGRDLSIRKAFTLPEEIGFENTKENDEYVFMFFDYSQVELRLTAHWSQDPTLLAAYPWHGEEQDVHSITCAEAVMGIPLAEFLAVYNDENHPLYKEYKWFRNIAKRVNFGIIYGAEGPTIQRQVSTPSRAVSVDECNGYILKYFAKYPGVKSWIDETQLLLGRDGYLVNTFGRFRRLPIAINGHDWQKERAGRQGVNYLIQGDAADVFKHAAVRVRNLLRSHNAKTKMVNFVHDEIQFYWHRDEFHLLKKVKDVMEDFPQYSIPIKVDIEWSRREWANKQTLKLA